MTNRERIHEVFTHYGYILIETAVPEILSDSLDVYYVKWEKTGKVSMGGYEIKMTGCYTDILDALLDKWYPDDEPEDVIGWEMGNNFHAI